MLKTFVYHTLFLLQLFDIEFEYKQKAVKIMEQKNKSNMEFFK